MVSAQTVISIQEKLALCLSGGILSGYIRISSHILPASICDGLKYRLSNANDREAQGELVSSGLAGKYIIA